MFATWSPVRVSGEAVSDDFGFLLQVLCNIAILEDMLCYLRPPKLLLAEARFLIPSDAVFATLAVRCCCLSWIVLLN